ncbi:hypothetical protein ACHQM5_021583 [Ranunculus cassubicifolius]
MDKMYESEKSSRRHRDDREKERDSRKDHRRERGCGHRHRSDRKSVENRSSDRYQSRDHSYDHEEFNQECYHEPRDHRREGSRDERVSREVSVDRPLLKRKERSDSEERSDKGEKRRKEEKREKRRVEVENSRGLNETKREEKREDSQLEGGVKEENLQNRNARKERRRKFGDRAKDAEIVSSDQGSSMKDGSVPELLHMTSNAGSDPLVTPAHLPPNKVCSISIPDENKIVSVTRSHEFPGKSSTDGTTSAAGKSGNLSVNAIVIKALQKQKELKEKLKKLPLNKVSNSTPDNTQQQLGLQRDGSKSTSTSTLPAPTSVSAKPSASAPVLRLNQYGNAIDEQGNIVNLSKPTNLSTLMVNINRQKNDAFQILKPALDVDPDLNPHFDERMGVNKEKLLRPKRMSFQFVEEGQWSKEAERIKFKSQFGEVQAKELRIKQALAKSKFNPNINPNLIKVAERINITKEKPEDPIPEVEWWDAPLLKSGELTGSKIDEDNINWEKMTIYVEHPQPIEPPAEQAPPPPQPLKLTPKEQKKMRTQTRIAKEKDRQEMIRQGLIEPPKSKVRISNLMKVLGSEATQDPTRIEMEIRAAAEEREQAHIDRNIARKRTPGEKKEKAERKLFEDRNNLETIVSVYKINDLSHPNTRSKVVKNAQENKLTGCVVIGGNMTVVVVEGGRKAITRYAKLMTSRIIWAAAVTEEEGKEDDMDRPLNKCVRVWQGSMAKPNFHKFSVHECWTEGAARKVFSDADVGHYWDLAVNFIDDQV